MYHENAIYLLTGYTKSGKSNVLKKNLKQKFQMIKRERRKVMKKNFFFDKRFSTFYPALPLHIIFCSPWTSCHPLSSPLLSSSSFLFATDLAASSCTPLPANPYCVILFHFNHFQATFLAFFKPTWGNVENYIQYIMRKSWICQELNSDWHAGQAHLLYIFLILWSKREG